MYAVVEIAGHQVRVDKGQHLKVPKLDLQEGASHQISEVLMLGDTDRTQVGQPHVEGAAVQATVLGHGRGDKIIVFKMKRRKTFRRRNGHRQDYTEIRIDDIVAAN